jgi:hypothetical protein
MNRGVNVISLLSNADITLQHSHYGTDSSVAECKFHRVTADIKVHLKNSKYPGHTLNKTFMSRLGHLY